MKHIYLLAFLFLAGAFVARSQTVDSIFFHLYTDSLKKGQHNYINVDGKTKEGNWLPMTARQVKFSSPDCSFSGNELIVPADYARDRVQVRAELIDRPGMVIERVIFIKQLPDPYLPGRGEVLPDNRNRRRGR